MFENVMLPCSFSL